ncbi:MAG: hypothetical protein KDD61_09960 [Bdellovibrionales bacterium]|nr:hypothetical protein [Bdellovibrionales bacterium]
MTKTVIKLFMLGSTMISLTGGVAVASDLGSRKTIKMDLNQMIESTDHDSERAKKVLNKSFAKHQKINDQELQNVVSDEINWEKNSEARIHRVPQSLNPPQFDDSELIETHFEQDSSLAQVD